MNIEELIGKKFNRWTVLSPGKITKYKYNKIHYVNCICDCGTKREVEVNSLKRETTKSCGCYNSEVATRTFTKHGLSMDENGEKNLDYCIWLKMKSRCLNANDKSYKYYGGRGITVCNEWLTFEGFLKDMGYRPSNDYSIERVEVDGNYEPKNCKWILKSQQGKNTRRVHKITYLGKEMSIIDWSRSLNISYGVLRHRITNLKMSLEDAIKYPKNTKLKNKI